MPHKIKPFVADSAAIAIAVDVVFLNTVVVVVVAVVAVVADVCRSFS